MKILHTVEFYYPSVGGSQEVVRQLSEHMVALGHDVTVATTKLSKRKSNVINGVKIKEFDISGNTVRGIIGESDKYKDFLINSDFDVIMNYAAQQWASDLFFEIADKVKAKKVFVPCGFSGLMNPEYKGYFSKIPNILKGYNSSVYLSDDYRDIDFARKHGITNTCLIPNGADEKEFKTINKREVSQFRERNGINENDLLFITIGSHTGTKGHKETIKVFKKLKLSQPARLIIVGNMKKGCYRQCTRQAKLYNFWSGKTKNRQIDIADYSRKETVIALKSSDLFIFLSNIECSPLVLFEAAAAGVYFVSTDVGNSREIVKWLKSGSIVKTKKTIDGQSSADIKKTVKLIERLVKNLKKYKKIAKKSRKYALTKYSWKRIAREYLDLYAKL